MLRWGFGRTHENQPTNKFWKDRYEALSENQKDFFHGPLPLIMNAAGIEHISRGTIPDLVTRILDRNFLMPKFVERLRKHTKAKTAREALEKYFEPFIGYEVNVNMETAREWVLKVNNGYIKHESKLRTQCEIDGEQRQYEAWKKKMEGGA